MSVMMLLKNYGLSLTFQIKTRACYKACSSFENLTATLLSFREIARLIHRTPSMFIHDSVISHMGNVNFIILKC